MRVENFKQVFQGEKILLNYLKKNNSFPKAYITYRILLTILITIASVERSFSKLKFIKTYLRLTMIQED